MNAVIVRFGQASFAKRNVELPLHRKVFMPKFIIERNMTAVGNAPRSELQSTSKKSNDVLKELGPRIQWLESFVTKDKIYCVYIAANEDQIRQHAEKVGIPANEISEVKTIIDPTTAEQ